MYTHKIFVVVLFVTLLHANSRAQENSAENQGDQFLKLASQLMQKEKFDSARAILLKAKVKGANPIIVAYNLGYIDYRQKKFVQSIKNFRFCIQKAPAFRNVYQSLSLLYNSLDLQIEGIRVLQEYIDKNGEDATFYILMGDLYRKIESYVDADQCYQRSLEINGKKDLPYISIANLYISLGDFSRALHVVESGIPRVDNPKELLLKKADILASLEKFIEAAGVCSLILDLYSPADEQEKYSITYAMASFYLDAGLDMLSIDILKDCVKNFPNSDGTALDLLEYIFLESGLYTQALEFYDQYFEKNRKKVYGLVRKIFQKVFQEKNESVIRQIIQFYDKYRLRDDIYSLVKETFVVSKGQKK